MQGAFEVNQAKKIYRINLEGFADPESIAKSVDSLEMKLKGMKVSEWSIVIDCRKLSTFKPEILPILERCYKNIYEKFKQAVLINPENVTAKMQLQRIARQTNFTGKFVTSEDELLNILTA
ncbi:hypothetical protein SMD22_00170 (plasmid) [Brevibacillus halotolerans]|nr:hypothetical protein SMD22_00170 [Brevibacillus halotolerans]